MIFYSVCLPGFLYTVCINMTSNQKFYAISSAATVILVGSMLMLLKEVAGLTNSFSKKVLSIIVIVLFCRTTLFGGKFKVYQRFLGIFYGRTDLYGYQSIIELIRKKCRMLFTWRNSLVILVSGFLALMVMFRIKQVMDGFYKRISDLLKEWLKCPRTFCIIKSETGNLIFAREV